MGTRGQLGYFLDTDEKLMFSLGEPSLFLSWSKSIQHRSLLNSIELSGKLITFLGLGVKDGQCEFGILPQILYGLETKPGSEHDLVFIEKSHSL
jgi:hypothetical protein